MTGTGPSSVVVAGGGSAGHVSPLLALADCLRRRHPDIVVTALGTSEGLEARLVPERGYPFRVIPKVPIPRRLTTAYVHLPARLRAAVSAAGAAMDDVGAQVVVGFGGYVSAPAYYAAWRRGIPIVVHEQNTTAGLANRVGARLSRYVGVTFADTRLPHATVVGMPLRHEIATLDRAAQRRSAREHFGLDPDTTTLLVTGGSLGAQRLNESVRGAADAIRDAGGQVLHVTGAGKTVEPVVGPGPAYLTVPYVDRMELAYAAADLIICRAGANTVCEVAAVGLPAIYVPLPIGNGEQRRNAAAVVAAGGGLLVDDAAFTADWVRRHVPTLLADGGALADMGRAAAAAGSRGGDERLADLVDVAWADHGGDAR